jgi:N-methylhydantoinase A
MLPERYIVATDVGGTCTDTVVFAAGKRLNLGKVLSTPPNFADGVLASAESAANAMQLTVSQLLQNTDLFVHGSTVVDNAIYTRGGSLTGLITTQGFEDTLPSTRGPAGRWAGLTESGLKHPVLTERARPLVTEELIRGVPERVDYKGAVLRDLDEAATEGAIRYLVERRGVEAIAVCLLWSFYNPEHEIRIADLIRQFNPSTYVTISSTVAPIPGEYERTSTTVINAYCGRLVGSYLTDLEARLNASGYRGPVLVMQGYGGLLPVSEALTRPIGMLESGPAAGVIGSKYLGELMGDGNVIAADMGGTTFKVGVIQQGDLEYARNPLVDRFHYIASKIEVVSIGAGGGSIVTLDPRTNLPRVGPRSAGANPGPVCYGRGGKESTLTDVLLLCGYMDPKTFLGGTITLDTDRARENFIRTISDPIGVSTEEALFGIYQIAIEQTSGLIREVTVERGVDPRDFVLHSFGGCCGMMCGLFAEDLNVRRIIVPYTASVNCAFGMVSADIVHEYATTVVVKAPAEASKLNRIFDLMIPKALKQLQSEGFDGERICLERSVDLRYMRQVHEVSTPISVEGNLTDQDVETLVNDFERLYQRKYGPGSTYRGAGVEMTMFRLKARGMRPRPAIPGENLRGPDASQALIGNRPIYVPRRGGMSPAGIYHFERLVPGNVINGPAVILTDITTIVIQDGHHSHLDEFRNVVIQMGRH